MLYCAAPLLLKSCEFHINNNNLEFRYLHVGYLLCHCGNGSMQNGRMAECIYTLLQPIFNGIYGYYNYQWCMSLNDPPLIGIVKQAKDPRFIS